MTRTSGKRVLAVAAAVLICAGLVVCGCGKNGGDGRGSDAAAESGAKAHSEPAQEQEEPRAPSYAEHIATSRWKVFMVAADEYDELPDLGCARADLDGLREALVECGVPVENIVSLESGAELTPTRETVLAEYDKFIKGISEGDLALVFLSGHGIQLPGSEGSFFAPQDLRKREVKETGVSINGMMDALIGSAAHFRWMIVDACRSGVDPDEAGFASSSHIFIKDGSPICLWQSCSEGEYSWESTALGHGVFTQSIITGLALDGNPAVGGKRDQLRLSALFGHVCRETGRMARDLTGGRERQTPQSTGSMQDIALLTDLTIDGATLEERNLALDHYDEAEAYFDMKKYESALTEIDDALRLWTPNDGSFTDLRDKIELAVRCDNSEKSARNADKFFAVGEFESALAEIDEALSLLPEGDDYVARRELCEKKRDEIVREIDSRKGAEEYEKGLVAYYGLDGEMMDRREAQRLFEIAAEKGNVKAKGRLALNYYQGVGCRIDFQKAFELASKPEVQAASAHACHVLCFCYRYGQGGAEQDMAKSDEYYARAVNEYGILSLKGEPCADFACAVLKEKIRHSSESIREVARTARDMAEKGCIAVMVVLGNCLLYGEGVEADSAEAFQWIKKSAERGCGDAMGLLGVCYDEGEGTDPDYDQALEWFKKGVQAGSENAARMFALSCLGRNERLEEAISGLRKYADEGSPISKLALSNFYFEGKGCERNPDKGIKLLEEAAEAGLPAAAAALGTRLCNGNDVEKDPEKGVVYLLRAEKMGDADAVEELGLCYLDGNGVIPDRNEALRLCRKAYELGKVNAVLGAGLACWKDGRGEEAAEWFKKGIDRGVPEAFFNLGLMHEGGSAGVEKNYDEALKLYCQAADVGNVKAMLKLGYFYKEGLCGEKLTEEGARWNLKAAEAGSREGMRLIAKAYLSGEGVPLDPETAVYWLRKAAEQGGDAEAMHLLSECYRLGDGVEHDAEEWRRWREKALNAGYVPEEKE